MVVGLEKINMGWRKNILKKGTCYRAKVSFVSGPSRFEVGEVMIFVRDSYSHYDNSTVYEFLCKDAQESKGWWLHDSESPESWNNYFDEVRPICTSDAIN